jgi:hypothetical protein
MGGTGSGRHSQFGADTTENYRSIDVRWLKREGLLSSGISSRITWCRGGEVTGRVNVRSEPGRVFLDYRQRDRGGEWQIEQERHGLPSQAVAIGRKTARQLNCL